MRSTAHPADYEPVIVEGARTTAAMAASRFGPVLKVSEDGLMSFYDGTKVWDISSSGRPRVITRSDRDSVRLQWRIPHRQRGH